MIARQLNMMLSSASRFQKYQPPSRRRVAVEAMCTYLYALFVATLGMFDAGWFPHKTRLVIGAHCVPLDYDTESTIFFYCVFTPLAFGLPLAYVSWVAFQIWRQSLLPPSGRRRILAVFFFRLAAVFLVMWLPGLFLLFVNLSSGTPWVQWAGGAWTHLQALVSALVSLLKPDIWKAVREFWCCTSSSTIADDDSYVSGCSIISMKSWGPSMNSISSSLRNFGSNGRSTKADKADRSGRTEKVRSSVEYDEDLYSVGALVRALEAAESSNLNCFDESDDVMLPPMIVDITLEPFEEVSDSGNGDYDEEDDDLDTPSTAPQTDDVV